MLIYILVLLTHLLYLECLRNAFHLLDFCEYWSKNIHKSFIILLENYLFSTYYLLLYGEINYCMNHTYKILNNGMGTLHLHYLY